MYGEEIMAINNMNDGVGKKIVEALKMQSENRSDTAYVNDFGVDTVEYSSVADSASSDVVEPVNDGISVQQAAQNQSFVDSAFNQSLARNLGNSATSAYSEEFEYPSNVAILKQLIAKLPSGVSKQTGAIIIKQTMEALGISMSSVLQEAKQFQESLVNSSMECKNNIVEYRKQISILEAKSQQYQRQSALMNDIISLFVQTN
jgi:hypothetical protein